MASVGTILDLARSVTPGSTFLSNGRLHGLALWDRLLDPACLGNQVHDSRLARVHCDPTSVKLMRSLHFGYEILDPGLSCGVGSCRSTATPKTGRKPDVTDSSNRSGDRF